MALDILKMIGIKGLRQLATTNASDEELASAIDAIATKPTAAVAKDAAELEATEKPVSKDAETVAKDAKRKGLHDALDKMLDSKDEEQAANDADEEAAMDALKSMFTEGGETTDSEHDDDCKCEDCMPEGNDSDEDDDEDSDADGKDAVVETSASKPLSAVERTKSPAPSAVDSALIKVLKPIVAQSKDKKLKAAFDTAMKLARGTSKGKNGSYGEFARSSARPSKSAMDSFEKQQDNQKKIDEEINKLYAERRGKVK